MSDVQFDRLTFWFALLLSLGTLVFYLCGAVWVRLTRPVETNRLFAFNLDAPAFGDKEELFAVALVAAGTSLSTVFLFFLTAGSQYGWWIAVCPLMFAVGNYLMFGVYRRVGALGYFNESRSSKGVAGLVPYLGRRFTGSVVVAIVLLLISILNLLAVLVLELAVGVDVLIYLGNHAVGGSASAGVHFGLFAFSLALLLGYVFVGGFAAVVASDLWQLKIITWAVIVGVISVAVLAQSGDTHVNHLSFSTVRADFPTLLSFMVGVALGNFLIPMSQEASWQRFRAFGSAKGFDVRRALDKSILKSILVWFGLIALAASLQMVLRNPAVPLLSMSQVLDSFRTLNDWWFPLCVFPVLTVAALSAMYSTADTCVSAILYLVDYAWLAWRSSMYQEDVRQLPTARMPAIHYVAIALLFLFCIGIYAVVRYWFKPSILQLVFSVFSNLIVIAPTILLISRCPPVAFGTKDSARTVAVLASLVLGSLVFWATAGFAIVSGEKYEWVSQMAIVPGLLAASLPLAIYLLQPGRRRAHVPA
jgi:hypothetical protein